MAKQSLVSKQESNPGAGLPVGFVQEDYGAITAPSIEATPYVVFASTKGQSFAKYAQYNPTLKDGDPVLVFPDPKTPVALNPLRFYLIHAWQHFSEVDSDGMIVRTAPAKTGAEDAKKDPDLREHVEAAILVVVNGELVPARCTFKTTKTRAIHKALAALDLAKTEAWGKQSDAHNASLIATDPRFRFTAYVTLKAGTSKSTGFRYVAADAKIVPSAISDWQLVTNSLNSEEFRAACDSITSAFKRRMANLQGA